MIAAVDLESITLDPGYQPPAMMSETDSASAFDIDVPVRVRRRPHYRATFPDQENQSVTLTDLLVHVSDPGTALARELGEKAKRAHADLQAYQTRIEALRAEAAQDGYDLRSASERDFWRFIRSEPFIRKGNLVLLDNGNLRAVWKDEGGTHVGVQFLGDQTVQYVIFKRRGAAGAISRVAGRDSIEGVLRQIAAFDLRSLIYA